MTSLGQQKDIERAVKAFQTENYRQAIRFTNKVKVKEIGITVQMLYIEGVSQLKLANYKSALTKFVKLTELQKDNYSHYMLVGKCYLMMNQTRNASRAFEQCIEINSTIKNAEVSLYYFKSIRKMDFLKNPRYLEKS